MNLGRLEQVELRTVWSNEATSFTPWLAEEDNIKLLGDAIGVQLAVESMERNVGPFRADILCKAVDRSDHWVLIENQIERTDHSHLGQIITYAAGLHSQTVVWIAQRFTDEHRAALDWLNEMTTEDVSFFGLEVELWRIGDSPAAPKFNIVSKPNEFVKTTKAAAEAGSRGNELYLEYWTAFKALAASRSVTIRPLKPQADYWMDIATMAPGIRLRAMASVRDKYNLVDLVIYNDRDKARSASMEQHRETIESLTGPLAWRRKEGYKESAAEIRVNGPDPSNKEDWPRQHAWMLENLERLHQAFSPLVRTLP